jgi:hypothetical protein
MGAAQAPQGSLPQQGAYICQQYMPVANALVAHCPVCRRRTLLVGPCVPVLHDLCTLPGSGVQPAAE